MIEVDFETVDFVDWGTVVEGSQSSYDMTFIDPSDESPIDITGWDITFEVKEEPVDGSSSIFSVTESTHSSPTDGESEITFTSTETADVFGTKYMYLTIDRPNEDSSTIAIGPVYFEAGP